jgi:phosphotransferase system  glucose/maltose/N-acetylglucosamine-specific IIC component
MQEYAFATAGNASPLTASTSLTMKVSVIIVAVKTMLLLLLLLLLLLPPISVVSSPASDRLFSRLVNCVGE